MEVPQVHSSFIPKAQSAPSSRKKKSKPMGFLVLISMVILILSLLGWGWSFLNIKALEESKEEAATNLTEAEKAFEGPFLEEVQTLDKKLKSAQVLLNEHVALSPFFSILEDLTYRDIRFYSMSISQINGEYVVSIQGEARNYETIALQSDDFAEYPGFVDPVFSNLDLKRDEDNRVNFEFDARLSRQTISYRNTIQSLLSQNDLELNNREQ